MEGTAVFFDVRVTVLPFNGVFHLKQNLNAKLHHLPHAWMDSSLQHRTPYQRSQTREVIIKQMDYGTE